MRISRFYCPGLDNGQTTLQLPESVHRHAVQVLRLRDGAVIQLFDGNGFECEATLFDVQKRASQAQLGRPLSAQTESPLRITLLQGISRGERMDYAIQKAVELGVHTIVPVVMERCNVQLGGGRAEKRFEHWQGVMISACEQSGRSFLPSLGEIVSLQQALAEAEGELKLVLDPEADSRFSQLAAPRSLTLLIGPEGGLTEAEVAMAMAAGYTAVQFGPRILRTETASTAALAVVQTLWGDLG